MSNPRPFRFASGVLHIFLPRDTIKINISKQKRPSQLMALFNYHYPENLMNNGGSTIAVELWKRPRQHRTERLLKISIFNKEKQQFCTLRTSVFVHFTVVLFLPSTSNDLFCSFADDASTVAGNFRFFFFLFPKRPHQYLIIIRILQTKWSHSRCKSLSNLEMTDTKKDKRVKNPLINNQTPALAS